jgi:hypothetical protein
MIERIIQRRELKIWRIERKLPRRERINRCENERYGGWKERYKG